MAVSRTPGEFSRECRSPRVPGTPPPVSEPGACVVRAVQPGAEHLDELGHLVDREAERAGADVLAPQRQHHQAGLVVPGDPQRAVATAGVEEDRPRLGQRPDGVIAPSCSRAACHRSALSRRVVAVHTRRTIGTACPSCPRWKPWPSTCEGRLDDRAIATVHIAAFSALKTFDPPLPALEGTLVDDVTRHGKFLDIARRRPAPGRSTSRAAGWLRWRDEVPTLPPQARQQDPAGGPRRPRRRLRPRHHRGRHQEAPRAVRRPRPAGRPRHRPPRARPARPTTSPSSGSAAILQRGAASRSRACCATRAPSPASATPTPTRSCTPPRCRRSSRRTCSTRATTTS